MRKSGEFQGDFCQWIGMDWLTVKFLGTIMNHQEPLFFHGKKHGKTGEEKQPFHPKTRLMIFDPRKNHVVLVRASYIYRVTLTP